MRAEDETWLRELAAVEPRAAELLAERDHWRTIAEAQAEVIREHRTREEPEWELGRWKRVVAPDGSLWCETSDLAEARDALRRCPGGRLERLSQRTEYRWDVIE